MQNSKKPTYWLIGGSSGLGKATLNAIKQQDCTLISGARSFNNTYENNVHYLKLDVSNKQSIQQFRENALNISNSIDGIIYCAGTIVFGACELTTPDEYYQVLNTNFLGFVRMVQEILPIMRKNNNGRIIVFSSVNGLLGTPYQSAYVASKHAIEGFCECLSMELHNYNIQICVVEPGDHKSGSNKYRCSCCASKIDNDYTKDYNRVVSKILHDEENGGDPIKLGNKIAKLLSKRKMPSNALVVSPPERLAIFLHNILPFSIFKKILGKYYLG